jgi:putative ABC transport system permease protein
VLGVPVIAGRDFTSDDRAGSEPVVIVSATLAEQIFPNGGAVGGKLWWTDPLFGRQRPRRIVGVVADVDDENVVRGPAMTIYHPVQQLRAAGRLFVQADGDPYAVVPAVRKVVHDMSAEQPLERAATLEDVRSAVLAPERLNAFVVAGFAGVALLIAAIGVAGVLAFSVSARTREFGVRLAVGSSPRRLLVSVLLEGAGIVAIGIAAGTAGAYVFAAVAASYFGSMQLPGALPLLGAAVILLGAAIVASLMPAARASRVDVLQALRTE